MAGGGIRVGTFFAACDDAIVGLRLAVETVGSGFEPKAVRANDELRAVDVLLCAFADDAAFAEGMLGVGGLLAHAHTELRILDFSRVSPWLFRDVAGQAAKTGLRLFGAETVCAGDPGVDMTIVVDDDVLSDRVCGSVALALGASLKAVGARGNAKTVALLQRHLHAVSVAATGEAIALGDSAGIPPSVLISLLLKGSGSNAVLRLSQPRDDQKTYGSAIAALDLSRMLGRRLRHPTWFAAVASEALKRVAGSLNASQAHRVIS